MCWQEGSLEPETGLGSATESLDEGVAPTTPGTGCRPPGPPSKGQASVPRRRLWGSVPPPVPAAVQDPPEVLPCQSLVVSLECRLMDEALLLPEPGPLRWRHGLLTGLPSARARPPLGSQDSELRCAVRPTRELCQGYPGRLTQPPRPQPRGPMMAIGLGGRWSPWLAWSRTPCLWPAFPSRPSPLFPLP